MGKKVKKAKKKGGCLSKIILIIVVLGVLGAFGGSDSDNAIVLEATTAPTIAQTAEPTSAQTQAPTIEPTDIPAASSESLSIPGIDGSNANDPIIDLESKGIKKPETVTTADGIFEWTSENVWIGSTLVSYQIHANEKHEILDATFTMAGQDNGFLIYAASLPYAAAEKEKVVQFVKDHMTGESASVTIGDAIFSIYPNERGAMLEIKDIDSDEFYSELLDKKLGL